MSEQKSSPSIRSKSDTRQLLRAKAEEIRRKGRVHFVEAVKGISKADMTTVMHELHVHQIELEMQNEELCRAHAELHLARERYVDLYNFLPVGYCSISKEGVILQANLTMATLLGVPQKKLTQQALYHFIVKEDQDIFYHVKRHLTRIGESQKCELRMVKRNGTNFWVSLVATLVVDINGTQEIRIVIIDISERRQIQEELLARSADNVKQNLEESNAVLIKSIEQLSALIQHAPMSIAMFDLNMNYLAANVSWMKDFGRGKANIIGLNHYDLYPNLPAEWMRFHQLALAGTTFKNKEDRWVRPDGNFQWLRWTLQPWLNERGVIGGIIIYCEDITVRKTQESQLLESEQQLRGLIAHQQHIKEDERIRIAREIHDELGSVLTGVRANLSVALHEDETAGAAPNQRISEACTLLDLAVNTVRKVITELRPSVLDHLGVWAALEWYAEQIEARSGLKCKVNISRKLEKIHLDAERSTALFRIAQESLTNVTRHANASQVEIRVALTGDLVKMEIEDNGEGIDCERLQEQRSWGIAGMEERARFFGGTIQVTDTRHGTLVALKLPLGVCRN